MKNLSEIMGLTMDKLREMVDVNAVVGNPITTPDGTTLIPVSKVSLGFASGGSDSDNANIRIGAGSGAGVNITPMAFIVVKDGNVRMIYIDPPKNSSVDKLIDMVPPIIDKLTKTKETKETEY